MTQNSSKLALVKILLYYRMCSLIMCEHHTSGGFLSIALYSNLKQQSTNTNAGQSLQSQPEY